MKSCEKLIQHGERDKAVHAVGTAVGVPMPALPYNTPLQAVLDKVPSLQCASAEQPDQCADSWGGISTPDTSGKENVVFARKPSLLSNAPSSLLATTVPGCRSSWDPPSVAHPSQPIRGTIVATDAHALDSDSDGAHCAAMDMDNSHHVSHECISSDLDTCQLAEVAAIQVRSVYPC